MFFIGSDHTIAIVTLHRHGPMEMVEAGQAQRELRLRMQTDLRHTARALLVFPA